MPTPHYRRAPIMPADPNYVGSIGGAAVLVSDAPGFLWGFHAGLVDSVVRYLQCFNANDAGDVTLGTTTPDHVIPLTPVDGNHKVFIPGITFSTGLVVAATTTPTNDAAPANAIFGSFLFTPSRSMLS